ncbi:tRNA uridine-5-carboxymethylaminomethyl(34) synthesis GTPase MnmE [Buchnera aphidicola (Taiwanaphis decaspermi)]|uniref:tRNA uridine-5-carboxymethylaminomethyl(34) synthesis GTPase MnmE n=1 Tax=Buchnera aphidicola TaxID=9 RepID=UPI0031B84DF0
MSNHDTIIAQSTPPGRGGIGVLRISGKNTQSVSKGILGLYLKKRHAHYLPFLDKKGNILDRGIAIWFAKPNSFTGEDILELHSHGGQALLEMITLHIINNYDVRMAKPGEFSERAFLNGKIDLIQAEAISDLISSSSKKIIDSSLRILSGSFSVKIKKIMNLVFNLNVILESYINFPEDIEFLSKNNILLKINEISDKIKYILDNSEDNNFLTSNFKIVIFGKPNVGKSSLLNVLSKKNSSIVTDISGTTRDILREFISIKNINVELIDTAGIHETNDKIEKIGIQKAIKEIKNSDYKLLVVDSSNTKNCPKKILDEYNHIIDKNNVSIIFNKIDTNNHTKKKIIIDKIPLIYISTKKKIGIKMLKKHITNIINGRISLNSIFFVKTRNISLLKSSYKQIIQSKNNLLNNNIDLLSENLSQLRILLGQITGQITNNEILNKIFSSFCIGK